MLIFMPFTSSLGGHINPAVTASLYLVGGIDSVTAGAYMATQMVAGVFGAALVWGSMADDFLKEIQNDCELLSLLLLLLLLLELVVCWGF